LYRLWHLLPLYSLHIERYNFYTKLWTWKIFIAFHNLTFLVYCAETHWTITFSFSKHIPGTFIDSRWDRCCFCPFLVLLCQRINVKNNCFSKLNFWQLLFAFKFITTMAMVILWNTLNNYIFIFKAHNRNIYWQQVGPM